MDRNEGVKKEIKESGQKSSEEGDQGEKEGVGRNKGVKKEMKERRGWAEMKEG